MMLYQQQQCQDVEYLEYELERYKEEERDRQEQAEQSRRRREQRRREEWQYEQRTAQTWPEALQKQAWLFGAEVDEFDALNDNYFADGADACKRALEIWSEVAASKAEAIAELEQQILAIKESVRLEVAAKLEAEAGDRPGWKGAAQTIKDTDETGLTDWLNW
ncbi:MAG: hypothetical protein ACYTEW_27240 [Planctomycetota bacterium]|jgi:hypothetical protein